MTASLPAGAHASGERLSAQLGLTERVLAGPRMRKLLRVVEDGLDRVEQTLARELKVSDTLADATTRYLYEAGGKRVRPMLTLLTAELGEGATDDVIAGATALEMTHLGSLYHDDVMDGADVRRGVPSAHAVWGNIEADWTRAGGVTGRYGYPTSDEYDYQGGKAQDFQGGKIVWRPES